MSELLTQLAESLGQKIARKYRVPPEKAMDMVLSHWVLRDDLLKLVEGAATEKAVTRTRVYKDAERDVTRKVYYDLRRYQAEQSVDHFISALKESADAESREAARLALVSNHVSTSERMAHLDTFWDAIYQRWGQNSSSKEALSYQPKTILDVGCGLLPLVYPFDTVPIERYTALDKSKDSVDTIQAFKEVYSRDELDVHEWHIQNGWDVLDSRPRYDIAFLFKLVPVVARQEPENLHILGSTPAELLIITGCKTAMVKQKDISRREKTSILKFIQDFNLELLEEFDTPDEIGFVVKQNSVSTLGIQ